MITVHNDCDGHCLPWGRLGDQSKSHPLYLYAAANQQPHHPEQSKLSKKNQRYLPMVHRCWSLLTDVVEGDFALGGGCSSTPAIPSYPKQLPNTIMRTVHDYHQHSGERARQSLRS